MRGRESFRVRRRLRPLARSWDRVLEAAGHVLGAGRWLAATFGFAFAIAGLAVQIGGWQSHPVGWTLLAAAGLIALAFLLAAVEERRGRTEADSPAAAGPGDAPVFEGEVNRVELLRHRYAEAKRLAERLIWPPDGIPDDPAMQARQQERAKAELLVWAKGTYEIIRRFFAGYEAEFFGPHHQLGASLFVVAFEEEVAQAGGLAQYLEQKRQLLAEILRQVDTAPVYVSRSRRALSECLDAGANLRDQIDDNSPVGRVNEIKHQVEEWAKDTSATLRREAPEYVHIFTRWSSAGQTPEEINGYLEERLSELRRALEPMNRR